MGKRIGLYEYLGTHLGDSASTATDLSHADMDTYDDDAGLGICAAYSEGTVDTRITGETYDDDPGLDALEYLRLGTDRSSSGNDTHDDHGLGLLVDHEMGDTSTSLTKVEGETYDDDVGLAGLVT